MHFIATPVGLTILTIIFCSLIFENTLMTLLWMRLPFLKRHCSTTNFVESAFIITIGKMKFLAMVLHQGSFKVHFYNTIIYIVI